MNPMMKSMMPPAPAGAINNVLQSRQARQTGPDIQALQQDPRFIALAQQIGPQAALQMMIGERQQNRASTAQGVTNLGQVGQQQDARDQLMAMAQNARM